MSSSEEQKQSKTPSVPIKTTKRVDYVKWDDYFMATAMLSAKRSKDPSTQVGACIVDPENRIVAIGYNGFPRGCSDDSFPWGKPEEKEEQFEHKRLYVVHAEANAILNRNSSSLCGTRLYTTLFPCNECTKLIIQSGISEIFYMSDKYYDKVEFRASKRMMEAANIKFTRYIPEQKRLVIDFEDILKDDCLTNGLNSLKL